MKWLEVQHDFLDADTQINECPEFDHASREAARNRLEAIPGSEHLFAKERDPFPEEGEEPPRVAW